jgi:hypothetical protein
MNGYVIKFTPGTANRFHIYRPGEEAPAFMVPTEEEAQKLVAIDRAQPVVNTKEAPV